MFTQIANQLAVVPETVWLVLATVVGLSAVQQAFQHFVRGLDPKVKVLITAVLAMLVSATEYLTNSATANPSVLGLETPAILGLMTLAYRFITKPLYNLFLDAQEARAIRAEEEVKTNTTAAQAAAPAGGDPAEDEFAN